MWQSRRVTSRYVAAPLLEISLWYKNCLRHCKRSSVHPIITWQVLRDISPRPKNYQTGPTRINSDLRVSCQACKRCSPWHMNYLTIFEEIGHWPKNYLSGPARDQSVIQNHLIHYRRSAQRLEDQPCHWKISAPLTQELPHSSKICINSRPMNYKYLTGPARDQLAYIHNQNYWTTSLWDDFWWFCNYLSSVLAPAIRS